MPNEKIKIFELLTNYRAATAGMADGNPEIANKWHDKGHRYYKQLRETEEGKAGIIALMSDLDPHVRCGAAAHSLAWSEAKARAVLEEIRDSNGACSLDAKWI